MIERIKDWGRTIIWSRAITNILMAIGVIPFALSILFYIVLRVNIFILTYPSAFIVAGGIAIVVMIILMVSKLCSPLTVPIGHALLLLFVYTTASILRNVRFPDWVLLSTPYCILTIMFTLVMGINSLKDTTRTTHAMHCLQIQKIGLQAINRLGGLIFLWIKSFSMLF